MFENRMINVALEWERRLEIEDEQRKNHRYEPYVNFLAPVQSGPKEHKSIFAWIFKPSRKRQPAYRNYAKNDCQETQPC